MESISRTAANAGILLAGTGLLLFGINPLLASTQAAPVELDAASPPEETEQTASEPDTGDAALDSFLDYTSLIKVSGPDEDILFVVTDPGEDGWTEDGTGYGSKDIQISFEDLSGHDAYLTSIAWVLYTAQGTAAGRGTIPIDVFLSSDSTTSVWISIPMQEAQAALLDFHTGMPFDFDGTGYFAFSAAGRDAENGLEITSIQGCASLLVSP